MVLGPRSLRIRLRACFLSQAPSFQTTQLVKSHPSASVADMPRPCQQLEEEEVLQGMAGANTLALPTKTVAASLLRECRSTLEMRLQAKEGNPAYGQGNAAAPPPGYGAPNYGTGNAAAPGYMPNYYGTPGAGASNVHGYGAVPGAGPSNPQGYGSGGYGAPGNGGAPGGSSSSSGQN
ncbi:hypothetical protein TRAPUB_9366 [Trametes pubescens]|uniref:Uncharacterized protein n=1 Tax=Trametes pubescens TaxID=154538 RepID=A0A1M2W2T0_TRAPU|nr:hypothetical protein TRAPUB_9366 [Trametes pubescens]